MIGKKKAPDTPVRYVDRTTGRIEVESRADSSTLGLIYGPGPLSWMLRRLLRRRFVSKLIALRFDRPASREQIGEFIDRWGIEAEEAEYPWDQYRTLNEIFTRKLRPGVRPIESDPAALVSPADGKVLVFPSFDGRRIPIKGGHFDLADLVRDKALAQRYAGGELALFRLTPPDYHRFHFPAEGMAEPHLHIEGLLDSVSPPAQIRDPGLFCTNRRDLVLLRSDHFGDLLLVAVGAIAIGGVVETYIPGRVQKGAEQGYFCYGGSAYLVAVEPGRVQFDPDLVDNSRQGLETSIRMGMQVARAVDAHPEPGDDGTGKS
ncbi:MAG: phosphatidylserine decarboxylase [Bradymonadales bacterium]|nr:phosphatidylserine decarboxylase [Bradymonadales bacterium]